MSPPQEGPGKPGLWCLLCNFPNDRVNLDPQAWLSLLVLQGRQRRGTGSPNTQSSSSGLSPVNHARKEFTIGPQGICWPKAVATARGGQLQGRGHRPRLLAPKLPFTAHMCWVAAPKLLPILTSLSHWANSQPASHPHREVTAAAATGGRASLADNEVPTSKAVQ